MSKSAPLKLVDRNFQSLYHDYISFTFYVLHRLQDIVQGYLGVTLVCPVHNEEHSTFLSMKVRGQQRGNKYMLSFLWWVWQLWRPQRILSPGPCSEEASNLLEGDRIDVTVILKWGLWWGTIIKYHCSFFPCPGCGLVLYLPQVRLRASSITFSGHSVNLRLQKMILI